MPNDFFQFQQFRIEQAACAMKVSTDACVLGAALDLRGPRACSTWAPAPACWP